MHEIDYRTSNFGTGGLPYLASSYNVECDKLYFSSLPNSWLFFFSFLFFPTQGD